MKPTPTQDVSVRLTAWHEVLVLATLVGLLVSGLVWLLFQYVFAPELLGTHPAQALSMRAHGAFAMVMLLVVGALLPHHVSGAWRARRNHRSGTLLLAATLLLGGTGWLLYYASSPALRELSSACHWVAGLVMPLLLAWHLVQRHRPWRKG